MDASSVKPMVTGVLIGAAAAGAAFALLARASRGTAAGGGSNGGATASGARRSPRARVLTSDAARVRVDETVRSGGSGTSVLGTSEEDASGRVSGWFDTPFESSYVADNAGWIRPLLRWTRDGVPDGVLPAGSPVRPPKLDAWMAEQGLSPETLEFGQTMRDNHFLLDGAFAFLNHGSYGSTLRFVQDTRAYLTRRFDANPVAWMEAEALPLLAEALRDLADFVGANAEDLAFVPNATTGVNAAARSFQCKEGDGIIALDIAYPACVSTLDHMCRTTGAHLTRVTVPFPFSDDAMVDAFEAALKVDPSIKFAMIDHVTSRPAVVLPVMRIAEVCKKRGIKLLVDGAHCVGSVPLNLRELGEAGVHAYTSNLHKWLCAPKGVAFLWVRSDAQRWVRPTCLSHGYGLGFCREFMWAATSDYTAYLTLPAALEFYRRVGPDAVTEHNRLLVEWGANKLAEAWGGKILYGIDSGSTMMCVSLPEGKYAGPDGAGQLAMALRKKCVEVPVYEDEGRLWVRISAQMYNVRAEYLRLAMAVKELQES